MFGISYSLYIKEQGATRREHKMTNMSMTAQKAFEITREHFDSIYFDKGIDVDENTIKFWAHFAFRQEVFGNMSNEKMEKRIARKLAKRYPNRYDHSHITFACPVSVGSFIN